MTEDKPFEDLTLEEILRVIPVINISEPVDEQYYRALEKLKK